MDNNIQKKSSNGIVVVLLILVVILGIGFVLSFIGVFNKDTFNKTINTSTVKKKSNTINTNTEKKEETKSKVNESDLSKETSVVLLDEKCSSEYTMNAKIVDGNIQISTSNGSTKTIKVGDAKYLYKTSFMACDNIYLMFITTKGQVYSIHKPTSLFDNPSLSDKTEFSMSDINSLLKQLSNAHDSAEAFIKNEEIVSLSTTDEYGYTSYNVGVLDSNGNILIFTYEYVKLP